MPHGGPHQKTTTFKEQKSDRPKGMPAFLSYTAPPKEDSWKTLSSKQLTERFNKPSFVISTDNKIGIGSARSIKQIDFS